MTFLVAVSQNHKEDFIKKISSFVSQLLCAKSSLKLKDNKDCVYVCVCVCVCVFVCVFECVCVCTRRLLKGQIL